MHADLLAVAMEMALQLLGYVPKLQKRYGTWFVTLPVGSQAYGVLHARYTAAGVVVLTEIRQG